MSLFFTTNTYGSLALPKNSVPNFYLNGILQFFHHFSELLFLSVGSIVALVRDGIIKEVQVVSGPGKFEGIDPDAFFLAIYISFAGPILAIILITGFFSPGIVDQELAGSGPHSLSQDEAKVS